MNKKIIAILLVFTLVITCFVACQKQKYETTKINGKDVLLATDENGNTIINEDNQVVAVVTDSEGEIITYEDGEEQTYYIDLPATSIEGKGYSFVLEEDGWIYSEDFDAYLKEGQGKDVYISITEFENPYSSLDEYMTQTEKENEAFLEAIKQAYPDTEISITDGSVTSRSLPCKVVETKIKDDKGIFYYGFVVDFEYNGKVVTINYTSQNYSYEETDVLKLFNEGFIFETDM